MSSLPFWCPVPAPRRSSRRRIATATVEFAVVAPLFFLFVLGIVEVGRGLMVQHLLLNAARQGCRAGILPSNGTTEITTAVSDALAPAGITVTSSNISVLVNDVSGDPATASSNDDITVSVTLPASAVSWIPWSQYVVGNISAQYTLRKQ